MQKIFGSFGAVAVAVAAIAVLASGLSACGNFGVHRIDIQQGNLVTQESVEKVKTGMSRNEVRLALGTPLLRDPFRADRWDYYFSISQGAGATDTRKVTVTFAADKVTKVEGVGVENEIFTGGVEKRRSYETAPGAPSKPPKS